MSGNTCIYVLPIFLLFLPLFCTKLLIFIRIYGIIIIGLFLIGVE